MKSIAIITARGGSKRIPQKNIKPFCGKPMLQYAIEAAQGSGCFDEIMVSTDDETIADISKKLGANIPFMRSAETSNDFATTADVLNEVLLEYKKRNELFEYGCCIYPCVPFLASPILTQAKNMLSSDKSIGCVYPVCSYSTPVERALTITEEGFLEYWMPQFALTRSQDLKEKFYDTGQFYFFSIQEFMENRRLPLKNTAPLIISSIYAQDIDNEEDWEIAELKYQILQQRKY